MFCSRDYQLTSRFNQQNEKSTSKKFSTSTEWLSITFWAYILYDCEIVYYYVLNFTFGTINGFIEIQIGHELLCFLLLTVRTESEPRKHSNSTSSIIRNFKFGTIKYLYYGHMHMRCSGTVIYYTHGICICLFFFTFMPVIPQVFVIQTSKLCT